MEDTNMNTPLDPMADQMKSEDEAVEETPVTPVAPATDDDEMDAEVEDDEAETPAEAGEEVKSDDTDEVA